MKSKTRIIVKWFQFHFEPREVKMFSEIYGYRVNLIYVAIAVALYDLFHILYEFKQRFVRFQEYEDTDFGCMSDMFQNHCLATYSEIGVYAIDLIFTCYLIYGASSVSFH